VENAELIFFSKEFAVEKLQYTRSPMKKICLFFVFACMCIPAVAQLTAKANCPVFEVDILDGKVNGFKASATNAEIKTKFPCFTSAAEPQDSAKCGTHVFYKDRDLYFYTDRDYIEIGPQFKGKLSVPLIGATRSSLFKTLGNPKIKDTNWEAYTTNYGILVLHFDAAGKVNKIQMSTQNANTLQLCN
jgi:hypothetical protein